MAEQFATRELECVTEVMTSLATWSEFDDFDDIEQDATAILTAVLPLIRGRILMEAADEIWNRAPESTGKQISTSMRLAASLLLEGLNSEHVEPALRPNLRLVTDE